MKFPMLAVATTALLETTMLTGTEARWEVIQEGIAQILQGVAAPTEDTVLASGAGGSGFAVLRSIDGGATFETKNLPDTGLAFGMDAGGPEGSWNLPEGGDGAAVVAGFLSWGYSTNSLKTIESIFDGSGRPIDQVRSIPDSTPFASLDTRKLSWGGDYTFGMAGLQRSVELGVGTSDEGPAISRDGGQTWTGTRMRNVLTMPIQHADWPTEDTWYVTSGRWSTSTSRQQALMGGKFDITENLGFRNGTAEWKSSEELSANENTYGGQIHKTSDGGRTWELQVDIDTMYFNKIACRDENVCAAASEGGSFGSALYLTVDGGATWNSVLELPSGTNLQGAEFVGVERQKLVAYGGRVGAFQFEGYAYSSSDWMDAEVAPTWEVDSLERAMFTSVRGVPGSETMYAVGVQSQNSASIMKYTPN